MKRAVKFMKKKINQATWLIWVALVIMWNYGYPSASPFEDVLVAVILSLLNIIFLKLIKNKN